MASIAMSTKTASPAAPPTTPPAIVPAGGALLLPPLRESELKAGSVLAGAAEEVDVYWLPTLVLVFGLEVDTLVCSPTLNVEPTSNIEDVADASLKEGVEAAAMVEAMSPNVVV